MAREDIDYRVAGFIGSHVARRCLDEGYKVVGIDDFSAGYPANVPPGIEFIEGDLAAPSTLARLPPGCRKMPSRGAVRIEINMTIRSPIFTRTWIPR